MVWHDPPLWTVGPWPTRLLHTCDGGGVRLAVFGSCSAGEEDLAAALTARDFAAAVTGWAGSYTAVRLSATGVVEVVTDAASACPVYTVDTPGGTVWGSSSRALSGLTGGRVDAEWMASYLLDRQTPGLTAVPGKASCPSRPGAGSPWTPTVGRASRPGGRRCRGRTRTPCRWCTAH
ncbi:hypothetical protein SSP35_21_00480 [Streptomyces sp. NBRC 110611]|nr:hypothetical protein SSP35_21_00480 [Streptomyces sp. NBRC 110611]